jgi:hypothetical protein
VKLGALVGVEAGNVRQDRGRKWPGGRNEEVDLDLEGFATRALKGEGVRVGHVGPARAEESGVELNERA